MASFNHQMLRQVRLDLGLTQEAAAAAIGMDVRTYRRYESGAVNQEKGFSIRHPSRRQILRSLCEQFGVEDEAAWLLDAQPMPPMEASPTASAPGLVPCVAHPLTRARHFSGRKELLARLASWHGDEASTDRILALIAIGGTGKTALVEQFLRQRGPDPGGVLVWSFYEDPRAYALLDRALAYFGGPVEPATGGQADRLLEALRVGPRHLLVLDGMEAIQSAGGTGRALGEVEDPALRRVLRAIAAGLVRCRVLATSRFELVDLAPWEGQGLRTLPLPDLAESEALELLRGYGVRGDARTLRALLDRVGRHALSVAIVGSYAGEFFTGSPAVALTSLGPQLAALDEPLARRLRDVLTAYGQALSQQERDLLCRLAVLPQGVPIELLVSMAAAPQVAGSLLGLGETQLLQLLRRLGRLGLVTSGPLHALHPFVRDYFRGLLGVPAAAIHELARQRVAASLEGRPGLSSSDPELLNRYEALLEHTFHAGRPLDAWSIYAGALGGFGHLGLQLGELSRGARVLRLLYAEGEASGEDRPALPRGIRAQVAYELGLYESALGDLACAERCYLASAASAGVAGGRFERSLVTVTRTLGYNAWLRGELPRAAQWVEESRVAAQAEGDTHALVRTRALAGAIAQDRGQAEVAAQCFREALQLGSGDLAARRGLWLAEHLTALEQGERARDLVQRNLAVCERLGWAGLVAHAHTVLGQLLLAAAASDPGDAAKHLSEARIWTRRTGEVEMVLRCHVLAARLALSQHDAAEARREATEGLSLARPCGFGLFTIRLLNCLAAAQRAADARQDAAASAEEALHLATAASCGYAAGRMEALALLAALSSP